MNIHTEENIDVCVKEIDNALLKVKSIPLEHLDGLDDLSRHLMSYFALSSDLMASAKYHQLEAQKDAYTSYTEKYTDKGKLMPPSIIKQIADSKCAIQTARFVKTERQNAGISHALEMIRTLISKGKSDREFTQRMENQNVSRR